MSPQICLFLWQEAAMIAEQCDTILLFFKLNTDFKVIVDYVVLTTISL